MGPRFSVRCKAPGENALRIRKVVGWGALVLVIAGLMALAALAVDETRNFTRQADWLSERARAMTAEVRDGNSDAIRFPAAGPFDVRNGYDRLPEWTRRLGEQGYAVAAQARWSAGLLEAAELGLFPPFEEKAQVGIALEACGGTPMYRASYPRRVYERFEAVPPLLVDALLHIENRRLLDPPATRNPAVEWNRLGKAVLDQMVHAVDASHPTAGGSTLATQIEKYRHSPGGRTRTMRDKAVQIASASLRGYMHGPDTGLRRRGIVVDYLNSVPLSAREGFGEVIGMGDALWAWYGRDFDEVNHLLRAPAGGDGQPAPQATAAAAAAAASASAAPAAAAACARALAFKQALSMLVAQRRPSYYLSADGAQALRRMTDVHLSLLAEAGIIDAGLRDAALPQGLELRHAPLPEPETSYVDRKATTALRNRLLVQLSVAGAYDLDRIDLRVRSTIAAQPQREVTTLLRSLGDADSARRAGLFGRYLLQEGDDVARIAFSFTLYERDGGSNLLRVQTDNLDQPLDLNEGSRLDLGSTAKLRTLVTYLEQVAALHGRWAGLAPAALNELQIARDDVISRWARDHLAGAADRALGPMLEAAMERPYSASPAESFYTGGGVHRFVNFESRDDHRRMSVREALTRSVNLVFIRLMRDVVRHVQASGKHAEVIADPDHALRREMLQRFADAEGSTFIGRFHRKYNGLDAAAAEELLLSGVRAAAVPLSNALYAIEPEADAAALAHFLKRRLPAAAPQADRLFASQGPGRWSLADRAYLAGVHPLELWLVGHLRRHPGATLAESLAASAAERQDAYAWLFKTGRKSAQDRRLRDRFELLAFADIQRAWQRLGYPFQGLTPSYATALGASGDRPAALAELMGIIVNGGLRLPTTHFQSLDFAAATPYETRFERRPPAPQRVLDAAVAAVVRRALIGVVEDGTAGRLKNAMVDDDGRAVVIGGKTGTGDHRFDVHGAGGRLLSSRIVNRSATLVFLLGDRHFGTLMAYVHEPYAADFRFTSSLPAQVLKALVPTLLPLVEGKSCAPVAARARPSPSADGAPGPPGPGQQRALHATVPRFVLPYAADAPDWAAVFSRDAPARR